jgi:predicted nuclease of predicted toxin-antitoxin system
VKLLLDQNLSPRLIRLLADIYPASAHVRDLGLAAADDEAVWRYAGTESFTIVTKDDDFRQRSFLSGAPPKVVWVHLGNCRTSDVAATLRARAPEIEEFGADPEAALLVLTRNR